MAFWGVLRIPTWVSGVLLAAITLPVVVRGTKGISALTELLVPIMTLGYLILSAAVLVLRRDAVGDAFASIFRQAFTVEGAGGGLIGFLTSRALRTGTMRGLLSNEACCGTAPTAHAAANAIHPAAQGVWGIFEVFVDTILLCTVTALVILVSFPQVEGLGADSVMMTIRSYSLVLGEWAEWFFTQEGFYEIGGVIVDSLDGAWLSLVYSAFYNGLYMIPETIISAIVAVPISYIPLIKKQEIK